MNKLILVALLCSLLGFAGENVDKLENQYFNKLDLLKKDYDSKTKALADSYVKGLKRILKEETKKGNFDEGVAIKAKIVELTIATKPSIIGEWHWHHGVVNKFLPHGKAEQYFDEKIILEGTWSENKDGSYSVHYPSVRALGNYIVSKETMISVKGSGNRIDGRRILKITN